MMKFFVIVLLAAILKNEIEAQMIDPMVGVPLFPLTSGFGIKKIGFGNLGGLKYGGIGGLKAGLIGGIPYSHVGGLYSKSLLLAPNPMYADGEDSYRSETPEEFSDVDGAPQGPPQGQMIETGPGAQMWVRTDNPQTRNQQQLYQQQFQDQQQFQEQQQQFQGQQQRQQYQQNFGEGQQIVQAPEPNTNLEENNMEEQQGRSFLRPRPQQHYPQYGKYDHEQKVYINLNPGYGGGYAKGYKPVSYPVHKGYGGYGGGYAPVSYGHSCGGYRSANPDPTFQEQNLGNPQPQQQFENPQTQAQFESPQEFEQRQRQNQQQQRSQVNMMTDQMVLQAISPQQQQRPQPQRQHMQMTPVANQQSEALNQGREAGQDEMVGSPFFNFMGQPFMGLWDPSSRLAQNFKHVHFIVPPSQGDNNYEDAPEN